MYGVRRRIWDSRCRFKEDLGHQLSSLGFGVAGFGFRVRFRV